LRGPGELWTGNYEDDDDTSTDASVGVTLENKKRLSGSMSIEPPIKPSTHPPTLTLIVER